MARAQESICAAVCWFTHADIFDALAERLGAGVDVRLLIECGGQNIRPDGLDFQRFIDAGGQLFTRKAPGLMHHKFAIVDGAKLLNGSFNWTYNSNAENPVVVEDKSICSPFEAEFHRLLAGSDRVFSIKEHTAKVFAAHPLFENTLFNVADLRKKVAGGTAVWHLGTGKMERGFSDFFGQQRLFFDADM